MSLFVAQRKAEKFRHMIHGSLYQIVQSQSGRSRFVENGNRTPFVSQNTTQEILSCEISAEKAGYGLALKDEIETMRNSSRIRSTFVDCDHHQNGLIRGMSLDCAIDLLSLVVFFGHKVVGNEHL